MPSANTKLAGIYAVCAVPWPCVWLVIFADLAMVVAVGFRLVRLGYGSGGMGFGEIINPATGEAERPSKTLWDWLDLLIVPCALADGAWWLNRQARAADHEIALDRQRENALYQE